VASWFPARDAVKEAKRQNPVPTDRKGILGKGVRISKHIIVTSEEYQNRFPVDQAGIGGREKLLPGEVSPFTG